MRIDSIEFNVFIDWINIMWPSDDPVKEQYENKVKWRIRKKAEKSKVKMICYFCRITQTVYLIEQRYSNCIIINIDKL